MVSNDEFYEENLLQNLVDLFGLSPENIRVTNVVPEDSRRGLTRALMTFNVSVRLFIFVICHSGFVFSHVSVPFADVF